MSDLRTVYLPHLCCNAPTGILLGHISDNGTAVFVIAVAHLPVTPENLRTYLEKHSQKDKDVKIHPLGVWYPNDSWEGKDDDFRCLVPNLFAQDRWISILGYKTENNGVAFKVEHSRKSDISPEDIFSGAAFVTEPTDTILVLYNQSELWDGEIVSDAYLKVGDNGGYIEKLFETVQRCKNGILSYESGLNQIDDVTISHCCVKREESVVFFLLNGLAQFLLLIISLPVNAGHKIVNGLPRWTFLPMRICDKVVGYSSFLSHVRRRTCDFSKSLKRINSSDGGEATNLEDRDVVTSVFVDVVLGVLMLYVVGKSGLLWSNRTTRDVFLPYVLSIASQVEQLIEWLMGIPAGLKLNHSLNQFLGHFFLYHVRLWLEYAKMMMDLFPNMITFCLMCSCLGFSFFLNIVADAVSTLSFHVYCFYVYAGRLYGLQVAGLMSMWRLFRGKKWNPLRKRVDSLGESGQRADQLFAGTLLFTILLFLLPTTALYYAIFLLLRIGILAIQALLSWMVFISSEFPSYSVLLRMCKPQKFIKSMRVSLLGPRLETSDKTPLGDGQAVAFYMRIGSDNVAKVTTEGLARRIVSSKGQIGVRDFFGKILSGDLIRWS